MKAIKNISMQGSNISFRTPEGVRNFFLPPKKEVNVPTRWSSKVVDNLVKRRMIRVIIKEDVLPAVQSSLPKVQKKVYIKKRDTE